MEFVPSSNIPTRIGLIEIQRGPSSGAQTDALVQKEPPSHSRFLRSATNLVIVQLSDSSFVGAARDAFWRHVIDKLAVPLIVSIESLEIFFGCEKKDSICVGLDTSKFALPIHKISRLEEANQVKAAQAWRKSIWCAEELLPRSFARAMVDATSMAYGISWRSAYPRGARANSQ